MQGSCATLFPSMLSNIDNTIITCSFRVKLRTSMVLIRSYCIMESYYVKSSVDVVPCITQGVGDGEISTTNPPTVQDNRT